MRLIARKDGDSTGGLFDVLPEKAHQLNMSGFGILTPVNDMPTGFKIDDVKSVKYWYAECDYKNSNKPDLKIILNEFIWPSRVVETKSGYHIYWASKNGSKEAYRKIQDRLCFIYAGDPNARNINRCLRAPGFYHMKDKNNPFLCKLVYECEAIYREEVMLSILPPTPDEIEKPASERVVTTQYVPVDNFSAWIDNQNQMVLLERLSGSYLVGGDVFKFVRTSGGKYNTYTNGKPSSWWIDKNGKIGSCDNGGPTVIQFVKWYGFYSYKELMERLKEFFR